MRMRSPLTARVLALACAWGVVGCTHAARGGAHGPSDPAATETPVKDPASPIAAHEYPGRLVPPEAVGRSFVARQVLRVDWQGRSRDFEVAVQLHQGKLDVVGLAPWGGKAFVLEQRGTDVTYRSHLPPGVELPFPPRFILQDISRAFLFDALLPWGTGAAPGRHEHTVGEERVVETWSAAGLRSRSFTRLDGEPSGTIEIDYGEGMRDGRPPARVELRNDWFGYLIEVRTVQYQAL